MKLINFILFILMVAATVLLIYNAYIIKSNGMDCLNSPLIFGYKQLEKLNPNSNILCSCTKYTNQSSIVLEFNATGKKIYIPGKVSTTQQFDQEFFDSLLEKP